MATDRELGVFAPFAGIVRFTVHSGQDVVVGDEIAVVEALKLEAPVLAPAAGTVSSFAVDSESDVVGGQHLATIQVAPVE